MGEESKVVRTVRTSQLVMGDREFRFGRLTYCLLACWAAVAAVLIHRSSEAIIRQQG
jgi:hypothetical protein